MIYILYHGGCFDGTAAAWVASSALRSPNTEQVLVPCTYGTPTFTENFPVNKLEGADVYLLDFSFKREAMLEIHTLAKSFIVLDHHKTAQAECEGLPFCIFDMNRSGAGITWDYFYSNKPRPPLVNYIEDRDLWRFKLPDLEAIHAWIASYPKDVELYDWLSATLADFPEGCASEGAAILRFKNQKVEELANEARWMVIEGYEVPLVNCPYQFGSDVAHRLLELYPDSPFSAYFCINKDGKTRYGLRGRDTDDFDVSEIAKQFGGGGHKKAAGYEVNV